MASLPTIVLVHGAWHTPENYQAFVDGLQKAGFTVHCPHLPTCRGTSPPTASLAEDVAHTRELVTRLVDAGERVLVLMHSYGGAVGTDAARGLTLAERRGAGRAGGVAHLVYLSGYMLPAGGCVWDLVEAGGFAPMWDQYIETAADGTNFPRDPVLAFVGGIEDKAVVDKALAPLVRFPAAGLTDRTEAGDAARVAWRHAPVTYVMTQQDYAVPRVYQDIMTAQAKEAGADLKTVDYDANHSVFLTHQDEIVADVLKAAKDPRNDVAGT